MNKKLNTTLLWAVAAAAGIGLLGGIYSSKRDSSYLKQELANANQNYVNLQLELVVAKNVNIGYKNLVDSLPDTKIGTALGSSNPSMQLGQVVASLIGDAGGAIGVRGRSCEEALGNLYGALGAKDAGLKAGFVQNAQALCGSIDPTKSYVLFEVKK